MDAHALAAFLETVPDFTQYDWYVSNTALGLQVTRMELEWLRLARELCFIRQQLIASLRPRGLCTARILLLYFLRASGYVEPLPADARLEPRCLCHCCLRWPEVLHKFLPELNPRRNAPFLRGAFHEAFASFCECHLDSCCERFPPRKKRRLEDTDCFPSSSACSFSLRPAPAPLPSRSAESASSQSSAHCSSQSSAAPSSAQSSSRSCSTSSAFCYYSPPASTSATSATSSSSATPGCPPSSGSTTPLASSLPFVRGAPGFEWDQLALWDPAERLWALLREQGMLYASFEQGDVQLWTSAFLSVQLTMRAKLLYAEGARVLPAQLVENQLEGLTLLQLRALHVDERDPCERIQFPQRFLGRELAGLLHVGLCFAHSAHQLRARVFETFLAREVVQLLFGHHRLFQAFLKTDKARGTQRV